MKRYLSFSILLTVLIIGFLSLNWMLTLGFFQSETTIKSPHNISFWYWNSSPPDSNYLSNLPDKVDKIFVRAGELSWRNQRLLKSGRVQTRTLNKFSEYSLHLTYHLTEPSARKFAKIPLKKLREKLLTFLKFELKDTSPSVDGIQLDFDVPTSQLTKYRKLLQHLKQNLPEDIVLSITTLHTWLDSQWFWEDEFQRLVSTVEFFAPMLFGESPPATLKEKWQPFDLQLFKEQLSAYRPYTGKAHIGIPSYGQILKYRGRQLLETSGQLPPDDFSTDYVQTAPNTYLKQTNQGTNLLFLPDVRTVRKAAQWAAKQKFKHVTFFRFSGPDDHLTIDPQLLTAANDSLGNFNNFDTQVLESKHNFHSFRFAYRPTTYQDPTQTSAFQIRLSNGRFVSVAPGDFQTIQAYQGVGNNYLKSSLRRANTLRAHRSFFQPGRRHWTGPIVIDTKSDTIQVGLSFASNPEGSNSQFEQEELIKLGE